jgi:hypothetical protein
MRRGRLYYHVSEARRAKGGDDERREKPFERKTFFMIFEKCRREEMETH